MTVVVDDPSGNSYIKNPLAPQLDKSLNIKNFQRNIEQLKAMGYSI